MRIAIVEDHVLFREMLVKFCSRDLGHNVVGTTGSGSEAKQLVHRTTPDIVLLDLFLPGVDGFEVIKSILSEQPSTRVLAMSAHCDDFTLRRVDQCGAHGFINKNTETRQSLRLALEALYRGESFFSDAYLEARCCRTSDSRAIANILSAREFIVLALVGQFFTDVEIADQLGISPATAQSHRSHIMRKLKIPGSVKLAQFAIQHGVTPSDI